ncbi:MAG: GNAT family N-acetyltransferase [Bacteriovorax sp.]|nr:GNAT family N-acetyltransferase [Bacteriovorax sp.]
MSWVRFQALGSVISTTTVSSFLKIKKRKGYAISMVALLSDKIMSDGKKFASLFTDLTNPTSHSIYQKIGFVKIGQNIHFDFVGRKI